MASVKVVKAKKWNSQGRRACDARTRKPPLVYDALKIPETKSLAVTLVRNFTELLISRSAKVKVSKIVIV